MLKYKIPQIVTLTPNLAWPKGSKLSGFSTFLQIKKNLECRFHNSKFLVAKLVFTSRFRVMQTMD